MPHRRAALAPLLPPLALEIARAMQLLSPRLQCIAQRSTGAPTGFYAFFILLLVTDGKC
jgi:hypothetical protein